MNSSFDVDLDTGRILYVGDGKGVDALDKFWKRVRRHNVKIEMSLQICQQL